MTTKQTPPNNHLHFFNHHTGRPRFHFDEAGAGGGAAAGAAGAAAGAGAAAPWHSGVDAEVLGFWQNKGIPLDDPKAFGVKLTEMYRGAEKLIGVPQDQMVRLPKSDAKPEDMRAFYERLGAPKDAKDYDFTPVKDTSIADALRNASHAAGLPKTAAESVAKAVATAMESAATQKTTLDIAKLAEEKATLAKNWGDKYNYNHLQAIEGARRLGITPEGVKALEGQIGYASLMEVMRMIGTNTREDTFVERGVGGPVGDVTTLEGAKARKAELMADNSWVTKYNSGDPAAKREMTRLNQMITGAM